MGKCGEIACDRTLSISALSYAQKARKSERGRAEGTWIFLQAPISTKINNNVQKTDKNVLYDLLQQRPLCLLLALKLEIKQNSAAKWQLFKYLGIQVLTVCLL